MDLKDPQAFRVLAHPLRLTLFERLAILGSATASQLAEHVDESPANCSFHLRVLAKHGYIERIASTDGRERPWRVVDVTQSWEPDQPAETAAAREAFEDALLEWDTVRRRQARRAPRPEAWKGKLFRVSSTLWLTPQEAQTIAAGVVELMAPYVERWETGERPEGGEPVRLLAETFLVPDPAAEPVAAADADAAGQDER